MANLRCIHADDECAVFLLSEMSFHACGHCDNHILWTYGIVTSDVSSGEMNTIGTCGCGNRLWYSSRNISTGKYGLLAKALAAKNEMHGSTLTTRDILKHATVLRDALEALSDQIFGNIGTERNEAQ